SDLPSRRADPQARKDDLDRCRATLDLVTANLESLQEVMRRQTDVNGQLADLVTQIQTAKDHLQNQPPDVTTTLAQLLESQEQDLILRSYETAWTAAQVGVGIALVNHELPVGRPIAGLALWWPMTHFQITQPFGRSP